MKKLPSRRGILAALILLGAVLLGVYLAARPRTAPGQAPLTDIESIDALRVQFNEDVGKARLILLVSPT